uniref:Uncharacterized protein n=1 Tax=Parascaris equorum TaxID=6256 RepID=A0A914RR86_PAREQ
MNFEGVNQCLVAMGRISAFTWRWCLRFVDYWKNIGNDYRTVCVDVIGGCKERPVKATMIATALAALAYAAYFTGCVIMDMLNALTERRQVMVLVPNSIHSPEADRIRIYHSQDANMKDAWWRDLREDIVDIGAFGRWYNLSQSFQNYDVNEDEFNHNDTS